MTQFLARVLINGLLLAFVLPKLLPTIAFHGHFWPEGVIAGFLFAIVVVGVDLLLYLFGVLTLGIGFVLRWLLWFVVPALQLLAMAHWFPEYLTISTFGSALLGGVVLMVVNALTNSTPTGRSTN